MLLGLRVGGAVGEAGSPKVSMRRPYLRIQAGGHRRKLGIVGGDAVRAVEEMGVTVGLPSGQPGEP